MSMNYDELERQTLNSISALESRACEDYSALANAVYHSLELGIMDRRVSVIDALLPVLQRYERSAKALISTLSNDAIIFASKNKITVCAIMNRETARAAFLSLKTHWQVDQSWSGLLAYAKALKNRKPKKEKTLEDLFKEFVTKAEKRFTRQEIAKVLSAYLPSEEPEPVEEVIIDN